MGDPFGCRVVRAAGGTGPGWTSWVHGDPRACRSAVLRPRRGTCADSAGYQRLVAIGEGAGEVGLLAVGLEGLARASMADSDAYQAATLLGRAAWLRATYDRPPAPGEQAEAGRVEAAARAALGDHRYDAAARQGADMGIGTSS